MTRDRARRLARPLAPITLRGLGIWVSASALAAIALTVQPSPASVWVRGDRR